MYKINRNNKLIVFTEKNYFIGIYEKVVHILYILHLYSKGALSVLLKGLKETAENFKRHVGILHALFTVETAPPVYTVKTSVKNYLCFKRQPTF